MARRTIEVTLSDAGRDTGKIFVITEMPASRAEVWADRAILAVANAGAQQDYQPGGGWAALALYGFKALFGIREGIALELLTELLSCVQIRPASGVARPLNPDPSNEDVEEIASRWKLMAEVFALHSGFSRAELVSMLTSALKPAVEVSEATSTSPAPSASSSPLN